MLPGPFHVFLAVRIGIRKNALARTSTGVTSAVDPRSDRSHIRDSQAIMQALTACPSLYVLLHHTMRFCMTTC